MKGYLLDFLVVVAGISLSFLVEEWRVRQELAEHREQMIQRLAKTLDDDITDINFNIVASIVQVTLTDGSSYIGYSDSAASFVGFYSTGAGIASMSITASSLAGGALYPTVDNLYFASVPAPGALALVGLAGLTARHRVRR
mgnify:CR=1 FL=1